jgi:tetratricopeptide (TPR) repeat protein
VQALVDLGELLYWDDPQAARVAYQEAVDCGHWHALLHLAKVLLGGFEDEDAALAAYQRPVRSGDPDVAAAATYELAQLHVSRRDGDEARALFEQVIGTGHAEWAAAAMLGMARLHGDDAAAVEALYWQAIKVGNDEWSGRATLALAGLLKRCGDTDGAAAALRRGWGSSQEAARKFPAAVE